MNPNENDQLGALVKSFNEFKETQYKFNTYCTTELEGISRGLYGDKKNAQPGIIDELSEYDRKLGEIRERVKTIEKSQYKTRVWLGVGSVSLVGAIEAIKSLWK